MHGCGRRFVQKIVNPGQVWGEREAPHLSGAQMGNPDVRPHEGLEKCRLFPMLQLRRPVPVRTFGPEAVRQLDHGGVFGQIPRPIPPVLGGSDLRLDKRSARTWSFHVSNLSPPSRPWELSTGDGNRSTLTGKQPRGRPGNGLFGVKVAGARITAPWGGLWSRLRAGSRR